MKLSTLFNRTVAPVLNRATAIVQLAVMELHVKRANLWRDSYNPLRGLTMRRAVTLLEEGERGAYADLQWCYRFLEKRDAVLRGGKRSLVGAVEEMDWDIRVLDVDELPQGFTAAQAEAQAETLRLAYERIDNLRAAIGFLALAEFRGYAHLEKHFQADAGVVHLEPVPQWHWCRDGLNGEWTYNADASSGRIDGTSITRGNFIIREVEDPINEIALIAFVRKNLSQKDWDGFVETFGIPSIFAIMPQNVPAGQESAYQELAEKVIGGSRGALPAGSDVKGFDAGARGGSPFRDHLRYQDEQIVLAITSGLLTMLAESGSGTLAGGAHSETFGRIARALAKRISETFQAEFDKEILAARFPGQPQLAYFEIAANEEQDTGDVIDHAAKLSAAGFSLTPEQIEEKTGYQVTVKPTGPDRGGFTFNRRTLTNRTVAPAAPDVDPKFLATARLALGEAVFNDLRPVLDELAAVLKKPDAELAAALQTFRKELPARMKKLNADPASRLVFEEFLGTAVVGGMTEAAGKAAKNRKTIRNSDQPRVPAGSEDGGQFASVDGGSGSSGESEKAEGADDFFESKAEAEDVLDGYDPDDSDTWPLYVEETENYENADELTENFDKDEPSSFGIDEKAAAAFTSRMVTLDAVDPEDPTTWEFASKDVAPEIADAGETYNGLVTDDANDPAQPFVKEQQPKVAARLKELQSENQKVLKEARTRVAAAKKTIRETKRVVKERIATARKMMKEAS